MNGSYSSALSGFVVGRLRKSELKSKRQTDKALMNTALRQNIDRQRVSETISLGTSQLWTMPMSMLLTTDMVAMKGKANFFRAAMELSYEGAY